MTTRVMSASFTHVIVILLSKLKQSINPKYYENLFISEEFIGVNVTEGVITHLQKHDVGKAECGAQISDILNMWGKH